MATHAPSAVPSQRASSTPLSDTATNVRTEPVHGARGTEPSIQPAPRDAAPKRHEWPADVRAAVVRALCDALVADYFKRTRARMGDSPTGTDHAATVNEDPAA